MSNNGNAAGLLSICRRAGKLVMGMDMVKSACHEGKAYGVYVASDLSEKSLKEVMYVCFRNNVKLYTLGLSMEEICDGIGKKTGIIAICDGGFNKKAASMLQQLEIDKTLFHGEF